jgi:hypothetical protein
MENVLGGLVPEGGVEGATFTLTADEAFERAALGHLGRDLPDQRGAVRGGFLI